MDGDAMKRCTKCGRVLPISEFSKTPNSKDGHHWQCKDCMAEYHHEHYKAGGGLEGRVRACRRNPTKRGARLCVRLALNAGRITKPRTCSGCGCTDEDARIEAHHADYSRPLDVTWLCTTCHRLMDQQRREREALEAETGRERTSITIGATGEPLTIDGVEVIDLDNPDLMTPREYAEATGQNPKTVRNKLRAGRIAGAFRDGSHWLIDPKIAMSN